MTMDDTLTASGDDYKPLFLSIGLNFIWINASEVFRYFAFVMPMMREAFPEIANIAPMDIPVFLVWGVWDTVLILSVCTIAWLSLGRFGLSLKNVLTVGTGIWLTIFGILWLGLFNMNLATVHIMLVALPLAWLEIIIAVYIVRWAMMREI